MMPIDHPPMPVRTEPRVGGSVNSLEEEEGVQLALTILRLNQRLEGAHRPRRRRTG